MRIEGAVTSLSWIPSEAVTGLAKLPFGIVAHYDNAPPDAIGRPGVTIEELRNADRFRFANELRAYADFAADGTVVDCGYLGRGHIGATTMSLGGKGMTFAAIALQDLTSDPVVEPGRVRFTQTAGGRTGVPAPRTVSHPPFVQYHAPIAWSTLALTISADGRIEHDVLGASPFPRHWIYGNDGALVSKSGLINFKNWYKDAFGNRTPWGERDSPALITAVETALERELANAIMGGGAKPTIRRFKAGGVLMERGDAGHELQLVLDGVVSVEHDSVELGQFGPGAVLGERAILEHGRRTSTIRAVTAVKVAEVPAADIDRHKLATLADGRRREDLT